MSDDLSPENEAAECKACQARAARESTPTEYRVLVEFDPSILGARVSEWLVDGWRLHGGLAACIDDNGNDALFQAMVR